MGCSRAAAPARRQLSFPRVWRPCCMRTQSPPTFSVITAAALYLHWHCCRRPLPGLLGAAITAKNCISTLPLPVPAADERSLGFWALGYGRASGRPAVVITSSGTAVANLLPAVVEVRARDGRLKFGSVVYVQHLSMRLSSSEQAGRPCMGASSPTGLTGRRSPAQPWCSPTGQPERRPAAAGHRGPPC